MALDEVVQAAQSVSDGPPEEWGFRAMAVGQQLEAELSQPEQLTDISRRLIEIARTENCHQILGASALGNLLAGGAVALADNGLTHFSRDRADDRVLIVDGTLVSGTQVVRAARQARAAGATFTPAAVVVSLNGVPGYLADDVDGVAVIFAS